MAYLLSMGKYGAGVPDLSTLFLSWKTLPRAGFFLTIHWLTSAGAPDHNADMTTSFWQGTVRALQASGLTLREIGVRVGLSMHAVSDIGTGATAEPKGWAAVHLYREACRLARRKKRGA